MTNAPSLNQGLSILRGSGHLVLHFEGRRAPTFARALEWLESGRADVEAIRPRCFPIQQYDEALGIANDKAGSGAVKISFTF